MALRKKGKYSYGDSQQDIRTLLAKYSDSNGYPIAHFTDVRCSCGNSTFRLFLDDVAAAALRVCIECGLQHAIGDSADYLGEAELGEAECPCGSSIFEVTAGVALYEGSRDVKWLYLGCRCTQCSLVSCYGDWKNEYIDYQQLLDAV